MKTVTALVLFLVASSAALAQDQQVGARTKAMGGSYTAFEDDPVSIWLNPAGIATQPDAAAVAYQTYTLYEIKIRSSGSGNHSPAEYGWTDPAIIPSFVGVTFQLGGADSPQSLGICFTTPFRLKFTYDDTQNPPGPGDQLMDQVFYRIRAAYAYDFRFKPAGGEGFFTHLALGLGLDVNVTNWSMTEFLAAGGTFSVSGTDMGFGGGAGLLLGLYDNTRDFKVNFGAAWQSKASYDFSIIAETVPLFDWPNQYQAGVAIYLLKDMPLRVTLDAQLIGWDGATPDSKLAGVDDFRDSINYSAGFEYRIKANDRVAVYPRAGIRLYQAPWADHDRADLPAIGTSKLDIDTRSDTFLVFSFGVGLSWSSEAGKQRTFDIAADVGGDAPGLALSFSTEF
ncbi:MAG TPA: hypothetical protein VJB14_01855 [Planctomycetota bacterium]|nr:hypothetical protein [Planctomycetota bacterium]